DNDLGVGGKHQPCNGRCCGAARVDGEELGACRAIKLVGVNAIASVNIITATRTARLDDRIVAGAGVNQIVAGAAVDRVGAPHAEDYLGTHRSVGTIQIRVGTTGTIDDVVVDAGKLKGFDPGQGVYAFSTAIVSHRDRTANAIH